MKQFNYKIKSVFAVLSVITILMMIFCIQGFAADNDLEYTVGIGETVPLDGFDSVDNCAYDPNFVSISSDGATALAIGNTEVAYTDNNQKQHTVFLTIKEAPSSVKLNAANITLGVGESFKFTASFKKNEACRIYNFSTNKPKILAYSKDGIFTAKKTGSANVSVTTYNGQKAVCKVTVCPLPKSISSEKSSYTIAIGKTKTAKIIVPKGYACKTYTYKSSAPSVVSINSKGKFQGLKVGSAKITVKSKNGKRASFTVYVNPMNVAFVNQFPSYPTGCEAAASVQLLKYYGYNVTLDQMVKAIPRENIIYKNGKRYGPDINKNL